MTDRPINLRAHEVRGILDGRQTQLRRLLKPQPNPCTHLLPIHDGSGREFRPDGWAAEGPFVLRDGETYCATCGAGVRPDGKAIPVRYEVGDRLWVKEAGNWRGPMKDVIGGGQIGFTFYVADSERGRSEFFEDRNKPSIHMPRWASRLTLTVTDVRVQRLQEISEEDAKAEGCKAVVGEEWWQGYRDLGHNEVLLHQTVPGASPPDWMIDPRPAGRASWQDRMATDAFHDLWNSLHGPDAWAANPWVACLSFRCARLNIDEVPRGEAH